MSPWGVVIALLVGILVWLVTGSVVLALVVGLIVGLLAGGAVYRYRP